MVLSAAGTSFPCHEAGSGRPLVLVHGALTDHRLWARHQAILSKSYRTLAFTQRYFGTDPWVEGWPPFGIGTHSDDLIAVVEAWGQGPVALVAWSYACHAALDAALRRPDLFTALFLYEPGFPTYVTDSASLEDFGADASALFGPILEAVHDRGDLTEGVRRLVDGSCDRLGTFESQSDFSRSLQLDHARTLPLLLNQAPPPVITAGQLGGLLVPTAVVFGSETRPAYSIPSKAAAKAIPGPFHAVIDRANHLWPDLDPGAFCQTVGDILASIEVRPEAVVQRQFEAFNARDLEAWVRTYAPDAVQYRTPAVEVARGRATIAALVADRFAHDSVQSAQLVRRTVLGPTVIDHEIVTRTFPEGIGHYELLAVYVVENGQIQTATFTFGDPQLEPTRG